MPAHPSYRLIAALRLLHAVDDGNGVDDQAFEETANAWRAVVRGQISPREDDRWRQTLVQICRRIVDRGRKNMAAISGAPHGGDGGRWRAWTEDNVRTLWMEEVEVAEAVVASVQADVEF